MRYWLDGLTLNRNSVWPVALFKAKRT